MSLTVTVSKEQLDVQKSYDSYAAYYRDCCKRRDALGVEHAKSKMRELDALLAKFE